MPTSRLHATILLVKVHILEGETRLINLRTRMPFKTGIATMTDVPYAFMRLRVEINGQAHNGYAVDNLPPKWFTKVPEQPLGEESGGLSVKGHVPEKDGILACLLMAELVAVEGKPLGKILKQLEKHIGPFFTDRINVHINPKQKEAILKRLAKGLDKIGTAKVEKFIATDGYKFLLPKGEWVAFRASGTEPVIRCYLETKSAAQMKRLQIACRKLLK